MTVGTAGHVDHGKTALVRALTGTETDRLPEERQRGLSIELGYAELRLPNETVSLVDVPGHERFLKTMLAGATGIDMYLLAVAADDGPMPQTYDHIAVLRALRVDHGVVAVTKSDLASPDAAISATKALLGESTPVIACSATTGLGVEAVRAAIGRVSSAVASKRGEYAQGAGLLHVDRVFKLAGAGTVVTGTVLKGPFQAGQRAWVAPHGLPVRIRSLQVHGRPVEHVPAGSRLAASLTGRRLGVVRPGDALSGTSESPRISWRVDVLCEPDVAVGQRRVRVHHGTRSTIAQAVPLGHGFHQLRCREPLLAVAGDPLVLRALNPSQVLGGAVVIDPTAMRHGATAEGLRRLAALRDGRPVEQTASTPTANHLSQEAAGLEQELLAGGWPPGDVGRQTESRRAVGELRAAGRLVTLPGGLHIHRDVLRASVKTVFAVADRQGSILPGDVRTALGGSRRHAIALLEHLDQARLTTRRPDGSRSRHPG